MKTVILSFDDSRADFYTNVFPLLKKYNLKATLNVTSDFIISPHKYSFPSSYHKAMTVEQVKECMWSGYVEVASHGHKHQNTRQDVIDSISKIKEWGIDIEGIGFASPESCITWTNKNEDGIWNLVEEGHLSYIRTGIQIRREGFLYSALSLLDRYIHSNSLYYLLNKKTIIHAPDNNVFDPFLLSSAVFSYTRPGQIKALINKAQSNSTIILMFHSVLKDDEQGYGLDRYFYDFKQFEMILKYITESEELQNCTTREFIERRNKIYKDIV